MHKSLVKKYGGNFAELLSSKSVTESEVTLLHALQIYRPSDLSQEAVAGQEAVAALRSASGLTLNYPSVKLKKTLEDRAFSSAAPTLWNSLPLHIHLVDNFERFKSVLKTHLFKLAFDM